jgi:L-ascorbate metabolism protein UlaG (beta-lactamase superfamily)
MAIDDKARRAGLRDERVRGSRQWKDGVFRNPTGASPGLQGSPWPLLGEYFCSDAQRKPRAPLPLERPHETWTHAPASGLRVTWLGHSTVLLEIDGRRVLTDPVFGPRASPLSFLGPKRFHPVPVPLAELPPLDCVLLSHDHYDHLCRPTMEAIGKQGTVPVVTSLGVGARLEKMGVSPERIHELDWGERVELPGLTLHATPAQHFSGRSTTDRNRTLWSSWIIRGEKHQVFFSGDTGLTPQFADIARAYGKSDLVMLEIGAWHPSWGTIHLGPANALEAFDLLGGGTLMPVHWGTFNLALHAWDEPADTLVALAGTRGVRLFTPRLGEALEPVHAEAAGAWWKVA